MLCLVKSLPWLDIEIYVSNMTISFYIFYRNIVLKNVSGDMGLKLSCDSCFQRALTACKVISLKTQLHAINAR
jgi:hypothetical protein